MQVSQSVTGSEPADRHPAWTNYGTNCNLLLTDTRT